MRPVSPDASLPELMTTLSAVWLRASCPCEQCLHPRSGQRLTSLADLPAGLRVRSASRAVTGEDTVRVIFEPDGHEAIFDRAWLAEATRSQDDRAEDAKRLWRAADFPAGPPRCSWPRYLTDAAYRQQWLAHLMTDGFVLFTDVPAEPGLVLEVAASLGFVRETNYGRLFDVKVIADPANLAYSARAIAPHTDNPW